MESAVRKKVDRLLDNLGWITNEEKPRCNVTTEVPKTTEQKKKRNCSRDIGTFFTPDPSI